jgi:hypothetical protein
LTFWCYRGDEVYYPTFIARDSFRFNLKRTNLSTFENITLIRFEYQGPPPPDVTPEPLPGVLDFGIHYNPRYEFMVVHEDLFLVIDCCIGNYTLMYCNEWHQCMNYMYMLWIQQIDSIYDFCYGWLNYFGHFMIDLLTE